MGHAPPKAPQTYKHTGTTRNSAGGQTLVPNCAHNSKRRPAAAHLCDAHATPRVPRAVHSAENIRLQIEWTCVADIGGGHFVGNSKSLCLGPWNNILGTRREFQGRWPTKCSDGAPWTVQILKPHSFLSNHCGHPHNRVPYSLANRASRHVPPRCGAAWRLSFQDRRLGGQHARPECFVLSVPMPPQPCAPQVCTA